MHRSCDDKIAGMVGNRKKGNKERGELLTQPWTNEICVPQKQSIVRKITPTNIQACP